MADNIEQQFRDALQSKLGASWDRAFSVFINFGPNLMYDVANVLLHADDQGKVSEVLNILEEHYESHLQFQHPDIRGTFSNLGVNPTKEIFLRICQQTLGLRPNTE